MTHRPQTSVDAALLNAARQVVWWMPPEEALRNETLFLNQAMQFGTLDVVRTIRTHYSDEALRQSLRDARAGIFDRRSWAYWHTVLDMGKPPPLPVRRIPGVDPSELQARVWPDDYRQDRRSRSVSR